MGWWASAVRELSEDTLEQVTSGLGNTRAYATNSRTIIVMHDMAVAELGRRSRVAEASWRLEGKTIEWRGLCGAHVPAGLGVVVCETPLDDDGKCANAGRHVDS